MHNIYAGEYSENTTDQTKKHTRGYIQTHTHRHINSDSFCVGEIT